MFIFACKNNSVVVLYHTLQHTHAHARTHTHAAETPGRAIGPSQKSVPKNHKHNTNIHATRGIRSRDLSKRATADLRLGRNHDRNRHLKFLSSVKFKFCFQLIKQRATKT